MTEKTSHKVFFQYTLEKPVKECPGGSHIVMKSTPRVPVDIKTWTLDTITYLIRS